MRGRFVERRFGWDTHGVPIEQIIDKKLQEELGVRGRAAVDQIGIKEYNRRCREVVLTYANEWRKTIGRVGRWIDFDRDYQTMHPSFMESCWWVFGQLYKKGLVYHGARVLPYSTALNTPLSKSEASEEYKDVQDPAITVNFPLLPIEEQPEGVRQSVQKALDAAQGKNVNFVAWTTTPWTLPSNVALCAHPDYEYLLVFDKESDNIYIMLEAGLKVLYKDPKKAKDKFQTLPLKLKGS
ncbi:isoleucyl-tRNA synthetase, partial [Hortaea werneckii]